MNEEFKEAVSQELDKGQQVAADELENVGGFFWVVGHADDKDHQASPAKKCSHRMPPNCKGERWLFLTNCLGV